MTGHKVQSAPVLQHCDCVHHAASHPFGNVHVQLNRFSVLSSVQCGAPLISIQYRGADKSLARPTSRCILFDGENISFHASLVIYIYIYSTYIPPFKIINRKSGVLISP